MPVVTVVIGTDSRHNGAMVTIVIGRDSRHSSASASIKNCLSPLALLQVLGREYTKYKTLRWS